MTIEEKQKIEKLAMENCFLIAERGGLDTRHSDELDFLDMSVWTIEELMIKAYEMGKSAGTRDACRLDGRRYRPAR